MRQNFTNSGTEWRQTQLRSQNSGSSNQQYELEMHEVSDKGSHTW